MKIQRILSGCLFLLPLTTSFAQQPQPGFPNPLRTAPSEAPTLTKFDLDFPGGTPKDFVASIQKASSHPLNVIIPDEFADTRLPALKMKNVDVQQLFSALIAASSKTEFFGQPGPGHVSNVSNYGFRSQGVVSDDTIWYFYVQKPKSPHQSGGPAKFCRFYPLARYLESGTTVDDITTAIKTGAKMLGEGTGPEISFHKDTNLLIAVGEPSKLEIIDSVLRALDSQSGPPRTRAGAGGPVEAPKGEKK